MYSFTLSLCKAFTKAWISALFSLPAFTAIMFTYGEEEPSTKSPSFAAESPAGIA